MKILFINSFYHPDVSGGAEVMLRAIASELSRRGCDVSVLTTRDQSSTRSIVVDSIDDVRVYRAPIQNLYWPLSKTAQRPGVVTRLLWHLKDSYNFSMKYFVRSVLKQEQPDLVVCHNLSGLSISVWDEVYAANIPIIQVLHDQYLKCIRGTKFNGKGPCAKQCLSCRAFRLRHRRKSEKVSGVVGVSRYILDEFSADGYFQGATRCVIYNARELYEILADQKKISTSEGAGLVFGFIGSLIKPKGIELLLNSFRNIDASNRLLIAGVGSKEYVDMLKAMPSNNNVEFLGYTKPRDFFSRIDVCIVPSIWPDTFPTVALEAEANGKPVIASGLGGLPEIVKHEHNGLLFDISDANGLTNALLKICEDRAFLEKIKGNAASSVANLVDTERMLDEYEALHESLVYARPV